MNNSILLAFANHLWQSTLFVLPVGCLAFLLRKNSARIRYTLWLVASVKFLVPFTLLTAVGAAISGFLGPVSGTSAAIITAATQKAVLITSIGGQGSMAMAQFHGQPGPSSALAIALGILWAVGALAVAARWISRWIRVRRALRGSKVSEIAFDIPVRSSASQLEPGVVGILRPVLLLPQGLDKHLTSAQMRAVLTHEHCHLVWRDNLAGALHMLVETLFWFHPLIWWLGRKLVDERERACDEYVIAAGHARESYAEGILKGV